MPADWEATVADAESEKVILVFEVPGCEATESSIFLPPEDCCG